MGSREVVKHLNELKHINLDGLRFRLIDAKGQVVGRLAEQISQMLQGKDKPTYNPRKEQGDVVIVTNAAHVHLTHDKWNTKLYRWHTGHPGGLKARTAREQWERDPTQLLVHAINGMLPKNKSRAARLEKLKVFPEATHPYADLPLVPYVPRQRQLRDQQLGWPLPAGFAPVNPERYKFRVMTSPALQGGRLRAGPNAGGTGRSSSAGGAAAAPPGGRPEVSFDDLLTAEERRLLAASSAASTQQQQKQQQGLQR